MKNYYNRLCTEMYEILHAAAPEDELAFYLSYAQKGASILEPLCGSGRFLVPFLEKGFQIKGLDNSAEMLEKLLQKAPGASVVQAAVEDYQTPERFDYIFISSGSVSLFTDMDACRAILQKLKALLNESGVLVFAVDTVADRVPDQEEYTLSVAVKTNEQYDLLLKSKSRYEESSHTQFAPALYELYDGETLLQQEPMDFQTHLYELGEMDKLLADIGFANVKVYSSFEKEIATNNDTEMFLYECRI